MRKQREEMRLGDEFAKMLPADITLDELNSVFGTAAVATNPPRKVEEAA